MRNAQCGHLVRAARHGWSAWCWQCWRWVRLYSALSDPTNVLMVEVQDDQTARDA